MLYFGPIFTFVNFSSRKFNHFAQRDLEGNVDEIRLFGKPDGLIASGRRELAPLFWFSRVQTPP